MNDASVSAPAPLAGRKVLLSVMMFLQYAIWGVWLPQMATYLGAAPPVGLGFDGVRIGAILGIAGACGAILAPFLAGQVADRFVNAEKWLGILLVVGGLINFSLFYARSFDAFLALSIAYSVVYMPTLALTNSICFAQLPDAERSFPRIRVWGTIGWIVASAAFPLAWLQTDVRVIGTPWFFVGTDKPDATSLIADSLRVSGAVSVLYGLFALTLLPATPPRRSRVHPLAFVEAFALLRRPSVVVVSVAALVVSMIHNIYFLRTAPWLGSVGFEQSKIGATMSVGQMVEIGTLALLGFFLARLGYKWVIAIGAAAYFLRFAAFALTTAATPEMAYAGIALHGFCYAFFFAACFLFVDQVAPKDARHSAQTAFGITILGLGPILAGFYNGWLDSVGAMNVQGTEQAPAGGVTAWWQGVLASLPPEFRVVPAAPVAAANGTLAPAPTWPAIWWTQAAIGLLVTVFVLMAFPAADNRPARADAAD